MIKKWCKKMPQLLNGVKKNKITGFFSVLFGKICLVVQKVVHLSPQYIYNIKIKIYKE